MKRILSGMRPTGKLHLGHWVGALSNWVSLQDNYQCFFMVADWHALMSEYKNTGQMHNILLDNVADWLAWGIDPEKSVVFIQSQVPAHLELFIILSLITPLGWVWRCPTFKEQIRQLKDKEVNTYAFLGYPVLQAADILLYRADFVPVGEDQLPHLEITRELVRRFHLGLDGRKMSKSYNNYISLDEEKESLRKKVLSMFTDPERKYKHQPGRPHVCNVFSYYNVFSPKMSSQVENWCRQAEKGCKECKAILADIIEELILPHREKKKKILKEKKMLYNILEEGRKKASSFAEATLKEAKKVMGL